MTIARFLKIWEVVRHFKSLFSTSLWMLIPVINILVAVNYAGTRLSNLPNRLLSHMYDKFVESKDDEALDGSREYWTQWVSESCLSGLYIIAAFLVNTFAVTALTTKFPEYSAQIPFSTPDWTFYISMASIIIVASISLSSIFGMLHQIYKAYTTMHPEYAKDGFRYDYNTARQRATAAREEAAAKTKHPYNPA